MRKVFIVFTFFAALVASAHATELSIYDCGSVARINKDVEAQSSHNIEIQLGLNHIDPSLSSSLKLVSFDGSRSISPVISKNTILFPAVNPGAYRICSSAINNLISKISIEDNITQAATQTSGLTSLGAASAAIGGGIAAIAFGTNSGSNQRGDSAARGNLAASSVSIENGPAVALSSGNPTKSPGESLCFVGHDEIPISPFS